MKITFLGTGTSQGVPSIACQCETCQSTDSKDNRTRASIMVEVGKTNFVIDTGTDFRHQMLREKVMKLDAVVFTHAHKDHTAGLDDIRPFYFMNKKDMPIYGVKPVIEQLKQEFAYIFAEFKYPGVAGVEVNLISKANDFQVGEAKLTPIEVMHYKLPVLGFRIQNFTYITDANFISEEELEKVKGTEILVLNALQKEEHISHFTLEQAIELVQKIQPKEAYFTHMSHRMGLHADISKELPENIHLAYDGLKLEIEE
ncbi:MAG: phosphoribosyl 1,2-cyclic phosphate phosphodiesterase [Arenicella sp.]|jgi:phosphoribosyl 1,2-cyclic phosphate phosphodiesterase